MGWLLADASLVSVLNCERKAPVLRASLPTPDVPAGRPATALGAQRVIPTVDAGPHAAPRLRVIHTTRGLAFLLASLVLTSCGAAARGPEALRRPTRENCLVLSVGGPAGVAHLGAIEALREAHVPIGCVVGSSMGAVVGALYAVDPAGDTTARFERFRDEYVRVTTAEVRQAGESGGFLGFLFGMATGGVGAMLLGAAGGAVVGSGSVRPVDHQRFVRVLDSELGHATIERLPVGFETMHQAREENSARVVASRAGSVADAVGASTANPFLFGDLDPRTMARVDPGFDRLSAVPVEAACEAHPGARLIAINLTGDRALLTVGHTCEVVDVRVTVPPVDVRAMMLPGPVFRQVLEAGRAATAEALARYAAP